MEVPITGRFEWIWLVLGGSAYVYYLVLKLPKGIPRLLALVPLLPFYIIVSWRGQTCLERALLSFFFLWMGIFKLIMVAYEYGPATDPWIISSFSCFLTGMSFSMHMNPDPLPMTSSEPQEQTDGREEVKHKVSSLTVGKNGNGLHSRKGGNRWNETAVAGKERRQEILSKLKSRSRSRVVGGVPRWLEFFAYSLDWRVVLLRCLFYLAFVGVWVQQYMTQAHIPQLILYFSYSILLYTGVLLVFELPAAIAASVFKVELPAQFNMPFLATSIADFWGRRWNLLVNNLLRVSIYIPILQAFGGRSGKRPSFQVKVLAVLASFTVSGIMHEIIFFYMSRTAPTFEATMFFVLNGAGTLLESWLQRKKYYNPSKLMGWFVTFCFVFFTAAWLFFPPLVRDGSDRQIIKELNRFVLWIRDLAFNSSRGFIGWVFAGSMFHTSESELGTAE
ncbi:hypothetical protein R1flu_002469 [Riccia fluitans]|uniref:Wax synthase domain-containing protein n=1 Tax=Riccia fluitans TaxID=41844 RepID=A0ABD1YA18_9MARC